MKQLSSILILLLLAACSMVENPAAANLVRGSGNVVSEERPVDGPFTAIALNTSGDLTVVQGAERAIVVEADDNILPHLTARIQDRTLTLGTEPGVGLQPAEPIRYTVTLPEIERLEAAASGMIESAALTGETMELEITGSGNLVIDALMANRVTTTINGSGSVTLAGEVQIQTVIIDGAGNYDGSTLLSERAIVDVGGSGDTTVWVSAHLDVTIGGSGDVLYYGDPQVEQEINGSGDLQQGEGR